MPPAELLGTTTVDPGAAGLISDGGSIWVSSILGVQRLDATTGNVILAASAGANATNDVGVGVAISDGLAWIGSYSQDRVAPIDAASGLVNLDRAVPVPGPKGLVADAGSIWATSPSSRAVTRVDAKTGQVLATVSAPNNGLIAAGSDAVWITTGDGTLERIDPATNSAMQFVTGVPEATSLAAGQAAIWVGSGKGEIARVNGSTGDVTASTLSLPGVTDREVQILGIAVSDSSVWLTGSIARTSPDLGGVTYADFLSDPGFAARLDPTTLSLQEAWQLDAGANTAALGAGALWTTTGFTHVVRLPAADAPKADAAPSAGSTGRSIRFYGDVPYTAAADRRQVPMDIYEPVGLKNHPVVVLLPGGPVRFENRRYLANLAAGLAERGALVLNMDYRSTATGDTEADSLRDVACGIAWARDHAAEYGGARDEIVAAGHSYGSDLLLKLALGDPPTTCDGRMVQPSAVAAIAGMDVDGPSAWHVSQRVPINLIIGALDDEAGLAATLKGQLAEAGFTVALNVVPDADHGLIIDARDTVPTMELIINAAKSLR